MIRRPPRSTLFPTRRSSDLVHEVREPGADLREQERRRLVERARERELAEEFVAALNRQQHQVVDREPRRSEEHTSELQSRLHLVCRLLLEKKKKETTDHYDS